MSRTRAYRCLNCLEHTIDREFDTSHLSVTCPNCESFERFVNEAVFRQFEAFEASPPPEFDWNRLDRTEKLVVAERLARSTKTLDDFEVVDGEAAAGNGAEEDAEESVAEDAEESVTGDVTVTENDGETAHESDETAAADAETVRDSETAHDDEGSTSDVAAKRTGGETA